MRKEPKIKMTQICCGLAVTLGQTRERGDRLVRRDAIPQMTLALSSLLSQIMNTSCRVTGGGGGTLALIMKSIS